MAEYLNRGDLIRLFEAKADMATGTPKAVYHAVCKMIALLPSDDVEEVRHGRWVPQHEMMGNKYGTVLVTTSFMCSLCGMEARNEYEYCHCGAKMDGKGEGE